jgi:hypothetical protein
LADECCGMLAHLIAYVGAPALLAIIGIHLWDELPAGAAVEPRQSGLERGLALAPGVCRQSARFARKSKDLSDPSASRGRPQGHLSLNASRRKAGPTAAAFERADPCSRLEMNRNWLNYSPAPGSSGVAASHQPHQPRQPTG